MAINFESRWSHDEGAALDRDEICGDVVTISHAHALGLRNNVCNIRIKHQGFQAERYRVEGVVNIVKPTLTERIWIEMDLVIIAK